MLRLKLSWELGDLTQTPRGKRKKKKRKKKTCWIGGFVPLHSFRVSSVLRSLPGVFWWQSEIASSQDSLRKAGQQVRDGKKNLEKVSGWGACWLRRVPSPCVEGSGFDLDGAP
jgi:hypothetical protein